MEDYTNENKLRVAMRGCGSASVVLVYAVVDTPLSPDFPLGEALAV